MPLRFVQNRAMTIDTIFIDFDGVLRRWSSDDDATEDAHGLPRGAIRRAAFDPARLDAAVRQWSASPGAVDAGVLRD